MGASGSTGAVAIGEWVHGISKNTVGGGGGGGGGGVKPQPGPQHATTHTLLTQKYELHCPCWSQPAQCHPTVLQALWCIAPVCQ